MLTSLSKWFDRVGPYWVGVIFAILVGNAVYFAQALFATWAPADPIIVTAVASFAVTTLSRSGRPWTW